MTVTVLCYDRCTTCKKALSWLDARGVVYTMRPIREEHPDREELQSWWRKSGLPLKRFFNTSGSLYRELHLGEKLATMGEEQQLDVLASDGMLVRRPLLVTDKGAFPGFREREWSILLGIANA